MKQGEKDKIKSRPLTMRSIFKSLEEFQHFYEQIRCQYKGHMRKAKIKQFSGNTSDSFRDKMVTKIAIPTPYCTGAPKWRKVCTVRF